ncbi:MAG: EAL domain-containing protein [Rhodoferax sp.]|nr:EAL domain-containing protein [Rhodoferax sp.]
MAARPVSFSKRIVLSFGSMVLAAVVGIYAIWYFGLPVLGVAGAADQKLDQVARMLELAVGHQRNLIQNEVEERRGDTLILAENRLIAEKMSHPSADIQADIGHVFDSLQRAYPDAYTHVRFINAADFRIRGSNFAQESGQTFSDITLLQRAMQPGVTELVEQSTEAGKPVLVIVRKIFLPTQDGDAMDRPLGFVVSSVDVAPLLEFGFRQNRDGDRLPGVSLVFGAQGEVLSRFPVEVAGESIFRDDNRLASGFEGTQLMPDGQGGEVLAVFRYLQLGGGLGWTMVHYLGKDEALRALRDSFGVMAAVGLLLSALALLVIAMAARHLTRPLKRLSRIAIRLGGGNLSVRASSEPTDGREIIELSSAFNAMAESVEKSYLVLEARVEERTQALVEQRDTAQRYLDIARVMLIALDRNGRITLVNRKAEEVLGNTEQDLLGLDWFDNFLPVQQRESGRTVFNALMDSEGEGLERFENRIVTANGDVLVVAWSNTVLRDARGLPAGTLSSGEDVTERQAAERRLKLAASVFTYAREGITITDSTGHIIEVNDTFTRVTGYSREEAIGQNPRILQSGRHGPEFYNTMWAELADKGHWSGEVWNRRKNGEVYAELLTISVVLGVTGKAQNYVALFTDITPMKDHQRQLEHIAHFDALTSLPNRVLLADRLGQALVQSQRRQTSLAVAFLDLDGFKSINDHHGHDMGDHLLINLAQRMKAALREGDTLARIGGDEFVAVLVDLDGAIACEPILKRLLDAASDPVVVKDTVLQVSASIGVTLYPQDGADADLLLRHADQAMYQAKQAGKNRYHLFDIAHDVASKSLRESLDHIRAALERQEFVLYYQPKVNMRTGVIIGAEALIRWQHPERGLLPPGEFLPVIEDDPLSIALGEWVIATALQQMCDWQRQAVDLPVSVNIGAHQLQRPDFAERLAELLRAYPQIPRYSLELEILETSALEDITQVSEVMGRCQAHGVAFALDDFGTGYSSLTYLKRLPAELLKIDQSFVRDMLTDADNLAIVQGVIGLAKAFGRKVIAEGVETPALGELLLSLGCDLAQGYGIARPMPAAAIPGWVATWQPDVRWSRAGVPKFGV